MHELDEAAPSATPTPTAPSSPAAFYWNPASLSLIARATGVVAMLVGILALLGWALDNESLKSVFPGLVAMNPATATAFLLAGFALNLQQTPGATQPARPALKNMALLLAAMVMLIGLLKLLAITQLVDFGIDRWLFAAKLEITTTGKPNRMAPNTALNFAMLGLSLMSLDVRLRRNFYPSQIFAIGVSLLSLLAIIGYIYGAASFYGVASFIPMALNTAACFFILAVGTLLSRPQRGFMAVLNGCGLGGTVARRLLPASLFVPVGLGWLPIWGSRSGYYGTEFSFALLVTLTIGTFTLLTCWTAASLEATERERRRAEVAQQEANAQAEVSRREAERARTDAEQANRAKSDFLSRMSHELRTPLNAILGFGQLLEIEELEPEQADGVSHILRAGNHLLGLINEVLDISRVEAGRLSLSVEAVPIAVVVAEAIDLIRPQAGLRGITLEEDVTALRHTHIQADQQRLKQVLLNLLSNAVKYNRQNGRITVICASASGAGHDPVINGDRAVDRVQIAVRDTGHGLSANDCAKLFTPFERLHAETSEIEGTGLGLSLSRGLMEAMQGTLSVASLPNIGTTFTLELAAGKTPLHQATAETVDTAGVAARADAAAKTVLCIEDNLANHKLIETILFRRPAVRLLAAMQGQLGLELAAQQIPDLILLDLHLPDLMGHEVLRRLRDVPATAGIPIIVVSADATDVQIKRLLAAGAQDYLVKPLNVREFLRVIDRYLWESASAPASE